MRVETYSELKTDIELIKKDILYIKENIGKLNKTINGNGTHGYAQRIERVEAFNNRLVGALIAMNVIWGIIAVVIGYLMR